MIEIARQHKLVPVPLDVEVGTMRPSAVLAEEVVGSKTRLLVVAHIFGARMDMAPWVELARRRGLLLLEDCAEVFEGAQHYSGHPEADISLFSFGSIKTCSALGGCIGWVRDGDVLRRMEALHAVYPVRSRLSLSKRLLSYGALCAIQHPLALGLAVRLLELCGVEFESFITNAVRGFAGSELIAGIRHKAPVAILRLLARKVGAFDREAVVGERVRLARLLCDVLGPDVEVPGRECPDHGFWLFPVIVGNPAMLIALLQRHGFDGTQGTSQLNYVPLEEALIRSDLPRAQRVDAANSRRLWRNLLYLPVYPGMSRSEVVRMGRLVRAHAVRAPPDCGSLSRAEQLRVLAGTTFDVLVVGGGINGCAVARDAAMRGLRVALVESGDFASGASGNSAKLIHGGFRYVERLQLGLVSELCAERDLQQRLNSNLVLPSEFILPLYARYGNRVRKIDVGLWLYDACARFANFTHRLLTPARAVLAEPLLRPADLLGAFVYYDCWTNDARLTLANARAAHACGAVTLNHCAFEKRRGSDQSAQCRDLLSGEVLRVAARHVVVATGPALDVLGSRLQLPPLLAATKGTHVAVPSSRLPVKSCGGYQSPSDKRWCFCVPFYGVVVIGTTEIAAAASDDEQGRRATRNEVEYLLEATNSTFSVKLTSDDVLATWSGLRPLVCPDGQPARGGAGLLEAMRGLFHRHVSKSSAGSTSSREERIVTVGDTTLVGGGKLTPYRRVAEKTVDEVVASLGMSGIAEECVTRVAPLDPRLAYMRATALKSPYAQHLYSAYGSDLTWIEQRLQTHPSENETVCEGLPFRMAEVSYAVLCEQACLLDDVLVRRMPAFLLAADNGLSCAARVAQHMAALLGRDREWAEAQLQRYGVLVAQAHAWKKDPQPADKLVNCVQNAAK